MKERFRDPVDFRNMSAFLESWTMDPNGVKRLFSELLNRILQKEDAVLVFHSRPGVSHSLRAGVDREGLQGRSLFALIDVVDDPDHRWLSVCFYSDEVTDPDEAGNLVPKGILGEDGYCFDLEGYEEAMSSYVEERIEEAYRNR